MFLRAPPRLRVAGAKKTVPWVSPGPCAVGFGVDDAARAECLGGLGADLKGEFVPRGLGMKPIEACLGGASDLARGRREVAVGVGAEGQVFRERARHHGQLGHRLGHLGAVARR